MNDAAADRKTPWLELAIGAFGAVAVVATVGYLLHSAVGAGEAMPADIVLERDGPFTERVAGWHVPVRARNLGDRPAEAVGLIAELRRADGEVERATLVLDFLPAHGSVRGAFFLEGDPGDGELRLRAQGYLSP